MMFLRKIFCLTSVLLLGVVWSGCKKLIEIDPPQTSINQENVYKSDNTAIAAVTGIYATMAGFYEFTGSNSISVFAGLSADELTLYSGVGNNQLNAYYKNALVSKPLESYGTEFWGALYSYVFRCNTAIEGLSSSSTLTPAVQQQLLGEARFMRAFFYFYLVNLYGDVPLALTTDPAVNAKASRISTDNVYRQMITDLQEAEQLLSDHYLNGSLQPYSQRLRPTKWAAAALLARTYLFIKDYSNAELEASKVISNASLFSLAALNDVFLKNSSEAIWQLQPVKANSNTEDAFAFILPATGPTAGSFPVYLNNVLVSDFETGDQRKSNWVNSVTANGITYYYPYKYKASIASGNVSEYLMMLRLGEQYLIRAEARAWLNNTSGARADLNAVRTRAMLGSTDANDQPSLLAAILKERRVELFTELGQRWFDLKRTGTVNAIMSVATPLKGGVWNTNWQLYPIPIIDIQRNGNLVQNPGY